MRKKKIPINTAPFKLGSTETGFNKRKISSPIIRELNALVSNQAVEAFSSKLSGVDFDVAIDKPSKQESPRSLKTKNCHVNEVEQTVKHSDEQVKTKKGIETASTEYINNAYNNTVQQNSEELKKDTTLILGNSPISRLVEKNMSRKRKIKVTYFLGAKVKDMYHYTIPLLEKKPENIVFFLGTNDAPYASGTNILKGFIELKDFILKKLPSCKKIKPSSPTVCTDKESAKKSNEILTNILKEQGITYITHDDIIHNHLYCDGLNLNLVGRSVMAENLLSYFRGN